jgi:osmotically-inducible protein OsmY
MKVDKGVVLFRGSVSQDQQKQLVLRAADGIEGIAGVVDEVSVADSATVVKPNADLGVRQAAADDSGTVAEAAPAADWEAATAEQSEGIAQLEVTELASPEQATDQDFSFRQALAAEAQQASPVMPGEILRTAAVEPSDDAQIVSAVVSALTRAKEAGQLRGFGVDVKSLNGVLQLTGRASSPTQRDAIITIAESVPGVAGVREAIAIPTAAPNLPRLPEPPSLQEVAGSRVSPMPTPLQRQVPARTAAANPGLPTMTTPYRTQGQLAANMTGQTIGMSAPIAGQPVPMAPHSAVGAPRYDSPNLPNYAWPGYAAHPNYAALTYPQQYSPSAWPYIGPFYPYPQVPLGWRKVSLEWDDGWWYLDFTDR